MEWSPVDDRCRNFRVHKLLDFLIFVTAFVKYCIKQSLFYIVGIKSTGTALLLRCLIVVDIAKTSPNYFSLQLNTPVPGNKNLTYVLLSTQPHLL